MSIYATPKLLPEDHAVIDLINEQKQQLKYLIQSNPHRWTGLLRRNSMALAIQGSNSIEGYHATMDDVVAAVEDEEPMDTSAATWREIIGYRDALTYIVQLAQDDHFQFHAQLLRSLHFMMLKHSPKDLPGRWRPGDIYVVNKATDERVYQGPDAIEIPLLIDELIAELNSSKDSPIEVRAAMAHLNLAMIHPFKDGNGRMARALQTLVLSREGIISPVFSSIEEWLGSNTQPYYGILTQVGKGAWHPNNDAHPWVQFCLTAHFQQAHAQVKRNNEMALVYEDVAAQAASIGLPERVELTLVDAAEGRRIRASRYRIENEVSDVVASRDLRKMCDLGLLVPHGEKRGRFYLASGTLIALAVKHKRGGLPQDPYDMIRRKSDADATPQLPGL